MTATRWSGPSELVPFWASFRWRKASDQSRALRSGWTFPTSVVVHCLCASAQTAEALVHVAEATSIVAEATTLISIYISECHLLALTGKKTPGATGR